MMRRMLSLPTRLSVPLVLALALGAAGCKKKEDADAPEDGGGASSAEEVAKKVEEAKQAAKASTIVELANKDLNNGRYLSAMKRANEALEENPENADAYAVLGAAYRRAGDFPKSVENYRKAIEIDESNYGANINLGINLQALGQHEEAANLQDKLIKDDPEQIEPRLTQLWSWYALADADKVVATTDGLFPRMPADDPILPLVQAYAAFMRPFEGKGPLCAVEGSEGKTSLQVNLTQAVKYVGGVVKGEFTQVVINETSEEAIIDKAFAKTIGLEPIGKFKPLGMEDEVDLYLVPEVKFGDIAITNVPAYSLDLSDYESFVGETPGLVLARLGLHKLGAITFDFPNYTLELSKDAPAGPSDGAYEVPLYMVSWHLQHAPIVPVRMEGSDHVVNMYLGGLYQSSLVFTKKSYFKSGKLPRHIDPLDDPARGLKMVYIDGFTVGEADFPGVGGLVLANEPPDATINQFLVQTAFEIGGFINLVLMKNWKVTYLLNEGKVHIST